MTLDTFTDTSPITVGQPTKRSDVNKVYANSFYLREALEPEVIGGATIAVGEWCYLAATTGGGNTVGRCYRTDATNDYSSTLPDVIGICVVAMTNGSTGRIRRAGVWAEASGLTIGSKYYLASTPGTITDTPPANAEAVAEALTATSLILTTEFSWLSSLVKAALLATPTGTGGLVCATSPALVTPALGTPASGVLTNCTGVQIGLSDRGQSQIGNVGGGVDDLVSFTVAANKIVNGFVIDAFGTYNNNANNKQASLIINGTTVAVTPVSGPYNDATWRYHAVVIRNGVDNNAWCDVRYSHTLDGVTTVDPANTFEQYELIVIDWSSSFIVKCTGAGVATNDIVQRGGVIRYF